MKNMKGFTLVELLAVIVILAIVALVTAPVILNAINDSRISGAQSKAWGTIEAVKLASANVQSSGNTLPDNVVNFGAISGDSSGVISGDKIPMSGDRPSSGIVKMTTDGDILAVKLQFNGNGTYYCSTNKTGNKMCCMKDANELDSDHCKDSKQFGTEEDPAS